MIKETIPELQKLSTADKFALAVELWDELSSSPDEMPVTEEQLNELDRRFEEYRQHPDKVVTWEEAKARIPFGSALMEVVLLLSAERDLQEAYNWVEEHRRGREQFFLQDVELKLEHLQKFPLIGRLYRGRYRRLLIPRYPLCLGNTRTKRKKMPCSAFFPFGVVRP
jgi:putative addiction module component (TIGR02574 family)